jgi:hypothetical protein
VCTFWLCCILSDSIKGTMMGGRYDLDAMRA